MKGTIRVLANSGICTEIPTTNLHGPVRAAKMGPPLPIILEYLIEFRQLLNEMNFPGDGKVSIL